MGDDASFKPWLKSVQRCDLARRESERKIRITRTEHDRTTNKSSATAEDGRPYESS